MDGKNGGGAAGVVELRGAGKRFITESGAFRYAVRDVGLSIAAGECVLIAGANGAGKSALAALIAGIAEPDEGTRTARARAGIVFQEAESQILGETALEDAAFGPRAAGLSRARAREKGLAALREAGLEDKAMLPARLLSGGEKRRLSIAAMLACDAALLVLDEPFANLDYPGIARVNRLLLRLKAEGRTLVVVTHELEKCLALAGRCLILERGRLVFDGPPEAALELDLARYGLRHPLRPAARAEELLWL